jgi:predicted nucleotidyltransferase
MQTLNGRFKTLPGSRETITISRLKNIARPVFRKADVIKALLFGSFARGTEDSRSDIDIFIIKKTEKRFLDRFDEFSELYFLFKDRAIDLLIYSPEEVERNSHRTFIKTILTEGVTIYEP